MAKKINIVEVGPRDGLQSEPRLLATQTKIEFIERVLDTGIRRIEVASFVNPKKVPQMADAEQVVSGLPKNEGASYIGLVLNHRGSERAIAAGVDEVGFVIVASETFNRRNQGVSIAESVETWHEIAATAREAGIAANITISAAFGCPFEGEVPEAQVLDIAAQVAPDEPIEIGLADTIGVAVPTQVKSVLLKIKDVAPGIPLRCHFHNTRNTGLANAYTAVESGVASLDASMGGMGGCPFANEAASDVGNIPTEDLLYMLQRSGVETGVSLAAAIQTSRWIEEQIGHGLPGMLPKAGVFPEPEKTRDKLAAGSG